MLISSMLAVQVFFFILTLKMGWAHKKTPYTFYIGYIFYVLYRFIPTGWIETNRLHMDLFVLLE